jgi:hypothetical protein
MIARAMYIAWHSEVNEGTESDILVDDKIRRVLIHLELSII